MLKKMKKYDEAIEFFEKSLDISKNFHALYNTATLYYEKQDYETSLEWFLKAREFAKPTNKQEIKLADLGLATVYEKLKRYDEAIVIYEKHSMKDKVES